MANKDYLDTINEYIANFGYFGYDGTLTKCDVKKLEKVAKTLFIKAQKDFDRYLKDNNYISNMGLIIKIK